MIYVSLGFLYLAGAVAVRAITGKLGRANPLTRGDCFTGDYALDFWICVVWPMFLPLWGVHWAASKVVKA